MAILSQPESTKSFVDEGVVVDLAPFAQKLMANEDISMDLSEDQNSRLVNYVREIVRMSYSRISKRYDHGGSTYEFQKQHIEGVPDM